MNNSELDNHIIQNYKNEEKMMILIYAQWCINNNLNPRELYSKAYPEQIKNSVLEEVLELTVAKSDSDDISDETVINALQLFGNDDLAFIVQHEIEKRANGF